MIFDFSAFVVIMFLIFGLGLFILNIITSIWSYRDANRKGKSNEYAMIVLFGTLFLPVLGFIVYLIIRND